MQVKALGNARFKAADYRRAMRRYKRALEVLEYDQKRDFVDWEEEQRTTQAKERVLVLNNMAAVLLKLNQPEEAKRACDKVLTTEPTNAKARYRKGCANAAIGGAPPGPPDPGLCCVLCLRLLSSLQEPDWSWVCGCSGGRRVSDGRSGRSEGCGGGGRGEQARAEGAHQGEGPAQGVQEHERGCGCQAEGDGRGAARRLRGITQERSTQAGEGRRGQPEEGGRGGGREGPAAELSGAWRWEWGWGKRKEACQGQEEEQAQGQGQGIAQRRAGAGGGRCAPYPRCPSTDPRSDRS